MIKTVVQGLGDLSAEFVFVGGAVTELYIDDISLVPEIRQTDDVDCIIEITTRRDYFQLEEKLRKLGFQNDQKVICRWIYQGVTVDIMPTNEKILGFSNRWYNEGIIHSIPYTLDKGLTIQILSQPYFIGCKLEALINRGLGDLRLSKDLEDIVFLLNYGTEVKEKIAEANFTLREYIRQKFKMLLNKSELKEAIFCVLPAGENEPAYVEKIIDELNTITR